MHDLRGREAVERRTAGSRVRTDVLAENQLAQVHVGKLLGQADGIQRIAGGAEDRTDLRWSFPKTLEMITALSGKNLVSSSDEKRRNHAAKFGAGFRRYRRGRREQQASTRALRPPMT